MIDIEQTKNYNILAINLDGLRKDKMLLSNSLKSLIEKSYYFSEMDTVAPYTFASIHSIFTGMYSSSHGVNAYYNMFKFRKDEVTTLAQVLKKNNYYTCCDINSEAIIPEQGFDEYNIYDEQKINFTKRHCELIKKLSTKKFFLFLQNTEIHNKFVREIVENTKENSLDEDYCNSVKENSLKYESYLGIIDSYIESIRKILDELQIYEKTILIIFSDHGTSLGEKNGERFYGVYLYDYTLNVFSIICIPNQSSKTITKQCRTIDIFPTILELIKSPRSELLKNQGESLISLINNVDSKDREVFAETGGLYGPWPSPKKHNVFCLKSDFKKIIYNDTPETWEFYNLKDDPDEIVNIYNPNSNEIIKMKNRLFSYLKQNKIKTKLELN